MGGPKTWPCGTCARTVGDCDQNDTVCQAAEWIAQGDLQTALSKAQAGETFAWRALLDITNDSDNLEHHLQLAKELETQWPQSDVPYRLRMDLAIDQKDWTAAYELRHNIIADDPDTAAAILKLALINQDYLGARNVNAQGEMYHPEVMFLRASALIQAGQYAEEKGLLKEAIPKGLGVEAQLLLARAHAGLNEIGRRKGHLCSKCKRCTQPFTAILMRSILGHC